MNRFRKLLGNVAFIRHAACADGSACRSLSSVLDTHSAPNAGVRAHLGAPEGGPQVDSEPRNFRMGIYEVFVQKIE